MNRRPSPFIILGAGSIVIGLIILTLTFYPLIRDEFYYFLRSHQKPSLQAQNVKELTPIDSTFGIIIPKLGANARIIPNVDPYDSRVYQKALTRGVAHAKGSAYPGSLGNVFLFAHSSENFYEAMQYNSIFYLINKLEKGDDIYLYHDGRKYTYIVESKKIVGADAIDYLTHPQGTKTVTLMTCWPPGTSFKRLLIIAKLAS